MRQGRYPRYDDPHSNIGAMGVMKFLVLMVMFLWPIAEIVDHVSGALGWVLGVPAELVYLAVLSIVWTELRKFFRKHAL